HRTARCLAATRDPAGRAVRGGPSGGPAATVRTSAGAIPGTRRVDDGLPRDVGGPSRSVCRRTRPAGQDPTKAQGGRQMTQADTRTTPVANKVKVQNGRPALTVKGGTDGGEEGPCGWLKDRWGVSWQVVPTALGQMMSDPKSGNPAKVMEALLKMRKLDLATLERAYRSGA